MCRVPVVRHSPPARALLLLQAESILDQGGAGAAQQGQGHHAPLPEGAEAEKPGRAAHARPPTRGAPPPTAPHLYPPPLCPRCARCYVISAHGQQKGAKGSKGGRVSVVDPAPHRGTSAASEGRGGQARAAGAVGSSAGRGRGRK